MRGALLNYSDKVLWSCYTCLVTIFDKELLDVRNLKKKKKVYFIIFTIILLVLVYI